MRERRSREYELNREYVICTVAYTPKPRSWSRFPWWPRLMNIPWEWSMPLWKWTKISEVACISYCQIVLSPTGSSHFWSISCSTLSIFRGPVSPIRDERLCFYRLVWFFVLKLQQNHLPKYESKFGCLASQLQNTLVIPIAGTNNGSFYTTTLADCFTSQLPPEVTLCSWRDVKISELTNATTNSWLRAFRI